MARAFDAPYDVAIVGAGASGCEAALRLARDGFDVLLVGHEGHDEVVGTKGEAPDRTTVVDSPADVVAAPEDTLLGELAPSLDVAADGTVGAWELHGAAKYRIEAEPRVHLLQSSIDAIRVRDGRAVGVETWEGVPRAARAVALCVGPFLRARLRIGQAEERAGRPGEMAYDELADDLAERGVVTVPARHGGGGDGRPAWTVRFERLADEAVEAFRVRSVQGLYAAGICRAGPMSYLHAAQEGQALARRIAADLGAADPSGPAAQFT